ncbi:hypothetical protein Ctha_1349 [Chloroherpeton thalassium ATCC 35110]|uniref:Capsular polysaccharide assembling protein CapF C-terminal domain-containing protein n=1 Tax=Chloroherpeton thalassium (strain ATCC 35110 / GB-78) TaxID=517418 RepID=B3QZB9_CHLT3|nr:hypothetical protein [Chloroherpeton thalassium]ACF13812.1 hypothetical protein Ctha_1349 [Chloroherpeton thalassium ATCC 35110]
MQKQNGVTIQHLNDFGDTRGEMFRLDEESVAFVGNLQDMHFGAILPGAVRGNHYHIARKELLILIHKEACTVAWQEGEDGEIVRQVFDGNGTVALGFEAGVTHAIKNTGSVPMYLIALSNDSVQAQKPDAVRNVILE